MCTAGGRLWVESNPTWCWPGPGRARHLGPGSTPPPLTSGVALGRAGGPEAKAFMSHDGGSSFFHQTKDPQRRLCIRPKEAKLMDPAAPAIPGAGAPWGADAEPLQWSVGSGWTGGFTGKQLQVFPASGTQPCGGRSQRMLWSLYVITSHLFEIPVSQAIQAFPSLSTAPG